MTFTNLLVATDLTDASLPAVEEAATLAKRFDATLHLLHVVTEPLEETWTAFSPAADYLAEVHRYEAEAAQGLERLAARIGPQPMEIAVRTGDPADAILQYAKDHDIDLVVCGTHGRRGIDRLIMGSVAERVVRLAPCSVLTVGARRPAVSAAA